MKMDVPFVDIKAQNANLAGEISTAIQSVIDRTDFILGQAVSDFEDAFAAYCGSRYAVGVDSGISALELSLRACDVGPGDEVICPAHTFIASASSISFTGATPVLVDVDPKTYLLDPAKAEAAITPKTKAILVVHLYGQPADMLELLDIANRHNLFLIEDAAQAHGAFYHDKRAGTFGKAGCFSFYPAKNLGAFGDGGMVVTDDPAFADRIKMLRNYGQRRKYEHEFLAYNRRLDTLQAAVLGVKLGHLDDWNARRKAVAERYVIGLENLPRIKLPTTADHRSHVFHLYVILHPERDKLIASLTDAGISCGLHYPIPIHLQPCYSSLQLQPGSLPVSERVATQCLSLPIFPEMTQQQVDYVCHHIRAFESNSL